MDSFISVAEEVELLRQIDSNPWLTDLKRRVQHYGWKYNYKSRSLDYSMYLGKLPQWLEKYARRLVERGLITELPDQVIINEYLPGQGIANHVDCEPCFGDTIVSISLSSPCVMNFINTKTYEKRDCVLQPRSAIILKGDSRYSWSHGIAARLADEINGHRVKRKVRISMTFRKAIVK